jgi:tetratricopeptide (TPR) repeat protein
MDMPSDEEVFLERIQGLLKSSKNVPPSAFALLEQGLSAHPQSAELWILKGELIQFSDKSPFSLNDALQSYEQAVSIDPTNSEAYECIGTFQDTINEDFEKAEAAFRQALALGGGVRTYVGLARVLAQMGRASEAIDLLERCPEQENEQLMQLRKEIADGIWSPS